MYRHMAPSLRPLGSTEGKGPPASLARKSINHILYTILYYAIL